MTPQDILASLDLWHVKSISDEDFAFVVEKAKLLNSLGNDQRLLLYGLFKQATVGDVNTGRPWSIDVVGAAKWDAWKSCEGISKEKSCLAYTYLVNVVIGGEDPDEPQRKDSGFTPAVSTMKVESVQWSNAELVFKFISENDIHNLTLHVQSHPHDVHTINEEGLQPIHLACDRGPLAAVQELVQSGADVNARDADLQTPIMLAKACGRQDIYNYLIERGADLTLVNCDGQTVSDL